MIPYLVVLSIFSVIALGVVHSFQSMSEYCSVCKEREQMSKSYSRKEREKENVKEGSKDKYKGTMKELEKKVKK